MAIKWDRRFATDDARIDEQHQQIFRFANRIEAFTKQDEVNPAEVVQVLRFLESYIQSHFRYEEACMLKRKCPVAQRNRSEHLAFKAFLTRTIATYRSNGYSKEWASDLYQRLEHWLSNHICRIDTALKQRKGDPTPSPLPDDAAKAG